MSTPAADLDPDPLRQFERWHEEAGGLDAVALADGERARGALGPHGPAQGRRRARLRLPFELRGPQGERARREPTCRPALPLAGAGAPGARRGRGRARRRGRVGGVLPDPSPRRPARRLGLDAERADRLPRGAGRRSSQEIEALHAGLEVPLPPHWGGFRLVPESYEFWEHRDNRMHDRFRYRREGGDWTIVRLSP